MGKGKSPKKEEPQNFFLGRYKRYNVLSLQVESYRHMIKKGYAMDTLRVHGFFIDKPTDLVKKEREEKR